MAVEQPSDALDDPVPARLAELFLEWYAPGGRAMSEGRLTLLVAGYATAGYREGLQYALASRGSTFSLEHSRFRTDLAMARVLAAPDEPVTRAWARSVGYEAPTSVYRAFRMRFDVSIADARRASRVARWLARALEVGGAAEREQEAWLRLRAFSWWLERTDVGLRTRVALDRLNRLQISDVPSGFVRYPPLFGPEADRLRAALNAWGR